MSSFKFRLLIVFLALTVSILGVSLLINRNHSFATSIQETDIEQSPEAEIKPLTEITLERTMCFGTCPAYKLTVFGDGSVIFDGQKFVKEIKTIKSKISPEQVQQLIKEFEKANYFTLKNKYTTQADGCPEVWTDNPSATTSIKLNGKSKSIVHYYGCQENRGNDIYPKGLTDLESKIDEIVNTKQWIK